MSIISGKWALISGATGGIGNQLAKDFFKNNINLILTGRNQEKLDVLASEIEKKKGNAAVITISADLSNWKGAQKLTEKISSLNLFPDILVNNAGIYHRGEIHNYSQQSIEVAFSVNISSAFYLCQIFMPTMKRRGWGRVLNMGSTASLTGFANSSLYCATKHALIGLTRSLAQEFRGSGVKCFCLCPSIIDTKMGRINTHVDSIKYLSTQDISEAVMYFLNSNEKVHLTELRIDREFQ